MSAPPDDLVDGRGLELVDWLLIGCRSGDRLEVVVTERGCVFLTNRRTGMSYVPAQTPEQLPPDVNDHS